ncbi:MAG: bifunctional phosphoglucose/phosphomannose isomerase [Candidatus Omnitrophota bacterium]|nr:bifunctional phosphoglucose/phosphomannose isomerase [Candidatus Omnitrophota bacterium]
MTNLDNPKIIKKYDKSNMLGLIEALPAQCADAKVIGAGFRLPEAFRSSYESVVATGLGGSAIGADLIRSCIADEAGAPLIVNRNYTLPDFVGSRSLVIASSYSGNTEETLSAYKDARRRKANVIAITSGGRLKALAENDNIPVVIIPPGLPPRCALGYSSLTLLMVLSKTGLVNNKSRDIDETIEVLKSIRNQNLGPAVPKAKNFAKQIAAELYKKFPVIYGGYDHTDSVVTRWRGQLSENAKTLSSGHIFPEMNHNEIVGWQNPKEVLKNFVVVILRDSGDHPRNSRRMDITKKILEHGKVKVIEARSSGTGLLARMFSLVYIGDFVSFYLSLLNREDPTPVDRVTYLKEELSKA